VPILHFDFRDSHVLGMMVVVEEVEENVPVDSGDIRLLYVKRIALESDGITHLLEKFRGTFFHGPHLPDIIG
jgi:hypothetical protein